MVRQEVLVIEDDPDVRRGLGVRLCAEDYQVHFATDAASGISPPTRLPAFRKRSSTTRT